MIRRRRRPRSPPRTPRSTRPRPRACCTPATRAAVPLAAPHAQHLRDRERRPLHEGKPHPPRVHRLVDAPLARAEPRSDVDCERLRSVKTKAKERPHGYFVRSLPLRHPLADVILRALGELLERRARRPAASRTGRHARRERTQAEADGPSRTGALASNQNAEASAPLSSASNGGSNTRLVRRRRSPLSNFRTLVQRCTIG